MTVEFGYNYHRKQYFFRITKSSDQGKQKENLGKVKES